jgi:hypothetical protein
MGRAILFLIIIVIAAFLAIIKSLAGKVSGNDELKNASLKGETKKVMDTTAKGVSWMEKQWEESKKTAGAEGKNITKDDS